MKLFLALPVYGGINPHFVVSLMALLTHRPRPFGIEPHFCIGDSLVSRARNKLCAEFLASDCTHLLFLDSDLVFSPEHIMRLVSHVNADSPAVGMPHIVAGLYAKKQKELGWVCNMLNDDEEPNANGLQRVKYAGTGCLLFSRFVLERMREALPEIEYDPDDGETGLKWDFFSTGVLAFNDPGISNVVALSDLKPLRRRYLSEDWMFCQRALDLGFDIWMDTGVILRHVGECVYPLQEIESFADPVAAD